MKYKPKRPFVFGAAIGLLLMSGIKIVATNAFGFHPVEVSMIVTTIATILGLLLLVASTAV